MKLGDERFLTISEAASEFGLSRATLLYYDRIGILSPECRNEAGYRFYGMADIEKLRLISELRKAGAPMKEIDQALRKDAKALAGLILKRLGEITFLISSLKARQSEAIGLLSSLAIREGYDESDLEAILAEAKIAEPKRKAWHDAFERESPRAHEELIALVRGIAEKAWKKGAVEP
jgi:DNA-binding transcriptional MerR regulator